MPTQWLPTQMVGGSQRETSQAQSSFGVIVNYDIYATRSNGSGSVNTWTEIRTFGDKGIFSHSGVYKQGFGRNPASDRYTRYDTFWQYSDEAKLYTLTVGDFVTRPLAWSNSARMGGIQLSHNFNLRPDLITYPLPQFKGEVGVPSTMDLLVNGRQYQHYQLSPGPFMINDVTHLSGAGNAVVVTTDALGRTVSIDVPFYVTSKLLKKGLLDYTVSVGAIRNKYGEKNFSYRGFAVDASMRYGLNDNWTLELHGEASNKVQVVGAGFVTNTGRMGVLNAAYTATHYSGKVGSQIYLGYDYNNEKFNLLANYIKRNQYYKDLTTVDSQWRANRESIQLTFSKPTQKYGGFSVGFYSNVDEKKRRTNTFSVGWNRSLGEYGSIFSYVNHSNDKKNGWSASLQWVLPLDSKVGTVSVAGQKGSPGNSTYSMNYSRSVPTDGGLGWDLGFNEYSQGDTYMSGAVRARSDKIEVQGGAYGTSKSKTYWGNASGSIITMDKNFFISNRVHDSFVVISTDGVGDVPVKFENNVVGTTNRRGYFLVPQVPSYYDAKYEIDALNIPLDLYAEDVEKRVVVKGKSGYALKFAVKKINAATIMLVGANKQPIPLGSHVIVNDDESVYVGWEGEVYFEHLTDENHLVVQQPDDSICTVIITLDNKAENNGEEIPHLGTFVCVNQ